MIWRWFEDWRDRRSTLRELRRLRREETARLSDDELNPLNMAKIALERGDLETAAARWEEARVRMADVLPTSENTLPILMGLKRFDEAEAMFEERRRRSPRDRRWATNLARIAEHRGDYVEAVRRWKAAQWGARREAGNIDALLKQGMCHRLSHQLDEAEAVFHEVLRRDRSRIAATAELARVSIERKDWVSAEARWRTVNQQVSDPNLRAELAKVLVELNRFDEADAIMEESANLFPGDLVNTTTRAHVAERRREHDGNSATQDA